METALYEVLVNALILIHSFSDWLPPGLPKCCISIPGRGMVLLPTLTTPVPDPTQSRIHWVPGAIPLVLSDRDVKLTTHFQRMPSSVIRTTLSSSVSHS